MRWGWLLRWTGIGLLTALLVLEVIAGTIQSTRTLRVGWSHDFTVYLDAARRWIDGGGFYAPYQLSGAYPVVEREILYPPILLPLLVPFLWLPAALWWIIPLGVLGAVIVSWRPRPWAIAGILLCLTVPTVWSSSWTQILIASGNPVMWVAAFVALATRWPFFGPLALLKPTPLLAPFALVGVRHRAWWIGLAVLAVISFAFLPMWVDYARVVLNARGLSWTYAVSSVPLLLVPVLAWLGNHDRLAEGPASASAAGVAQGVVGDLG